MVTIRKQKIYESDPPATKGEVNSGELITDEVHIPLPDLVADFIQAGARLQRQREEYYHDKYGKDEMEDFVPMPPSADPTEAQVFMESVSARLQAKASKIEEEQHARDVARAEAEAARSAPVNGQGESGAEGTPNLQGGT